LKPIVVSISAEGIVGQLQLTGHYVFISHPRVVWDICGHVCLDEKTEQIASLDVLPLNTTLTIDLRRREYFGFLLRYHVLTDRANAFVHACDCTGAISGLMICQVKYIGFYLDERSHTIIRAGGNIAVIMNFKLKGLNVVILLNHSHISGGPT